MEKGSYGNMESGFYKPENIKYFFNGEEINENITLPVEVAREAIAGTLPEVVTQHTGPAAKEMALARDAASDGNLQAAAEHAENAERSTGVIGWFAGKTGFMKAVVLGTSLLAASCAPKGKTETYTERVSESVLPKSVDVSAYWVGKSWGNLWGDLKKGEFDWASFKKIINPFDVSATISGKDTQAEAILLYNLSRAFNNGDLKNPTDVGKMEAFFKGHTTKKMNDAIFSFFSEGTRAEFERQFPQYAEEGIQNHIKKIVFLHGASPEGKQSQNWEKGKVDKENIQLANLRVKAEKGTLAILKKLGVPYDAKTIERASQENQLHWYSVIALTRLATKHNTDVAGLIEMVNTKQNLDAETIEAVNNILEPLRNERVVVQMENDQSTSVAVPFSPLFLLLICLIRPEWCRRGGNINGGGGGGGGGGQGLPPGGVPPTEVAPVPPAVATVERIDAAPEKNPRDYADDAHGRIVTQRTGYYELLFRLLTDEAEARPHSAGAGLENASDREIARNRIARLLLDNWTADANAIRAEAGLQTVDLASMNDQRMDALVLATTIQRLVGEGARTESLSTYRELMLEPRIRDLVLQDITVMLQEMYDRNPELRQNRPAGSARDLSA